MKLHHIAIWTFRLEELKEFYVRFFGGKSNEKYINPKKGFESYFISFGEGTDLEPVSYTHLRAHETRHDLVCRLLLEKKKKKKNKTITN